MSNVNIYEIVGGSLALAEMRRAQEQARIAAMKAWAKEHLGIDGDALRFSQNERGLRAIVYDDTPPVGFKRVRLSGHAAIEPEISTKAGKAIAEEWAKFGSADWTDFANHFCDVRLGIHVDGQGNLGIYRPRVVFVGDRAFLAIAQEIVPPHCDLRAMKMWEFDKLVDEQRQVEEEAPL